jgi:hypothetical protein
MSTPEITYEPCPICGDTDHPGQRVAAPPEDLPRAKDGEGRTHGKVATYIAGCRCEQCRAANRAAWHRRRKA